MMPPFESPKGTTMVGVRVSSAAVVALGSSGRGDGATGTLPDTVVGLGVAPRHVQPHTCWHSRSSL